MFQQILQEEYRIHAERCKVDAKIVSQQALLDYVRSYELRKLLDAVKIFDELFKYLVSTHEERIIANPHTITLLRMTGKKEEEES